MKSSSYKRVFYPSEDFWNDSYSMEENYPEETTDLLEDPEPEDLQKLTLLAEVLSSNSSNSGTTSGP